MLDLRGNGGGLLTEAVLTSSLFVEDGTIVSTEGRTQDDRDLRSDRRRAPEHPMVVLINGDTASASEIMTAALEQAGLATVVASSSFGKGTFQEVIPLDNGGALDLTVGEYLTRDGDIDQRHRDQARGPGQGRPATKPDEALERALQALGAQLSEQESSQEKDAERLRSAGASSSISKRGRFLVGEPLFERGGQDRRSAGDARAAARPDGAGRARPGRVGRG